ncbi:MAG: VIT1/CCC1 transporter family protein [Parvularculaceae bacterium]|nr:VIT1/CCC1 transporter family protein [Parvularculaceae bacterium]
MLGNSQHFERPYLKMTCSHIEHERSWRREKAAAYLTRAVAAAEKDPVIKRLFEELAAECEGQAAIIARKYKTDRAFTPNLRTRIVEKLIAIFGPRRIRIVLTAMKVRGLSVYSGRMLPGAHAMPTTIGEIGARHRRGNGGVLRAGVFGVNDGLVSNTSLVLGMAGAGVANETVFITGVAGLLAGAFSMAAGEYVSMRTQREMFEYQIAQEKEELELYPEEEAEELALIYEARGLPLEEARSVAKKLIADPVTALDTLAREELGLNPDDLGSAAGAGLSSFAAFSGGAFLPLIPFLAGASSPVPFACIIAGFALFGVGAITSLFSGRNAFLGGVRMLVIGALAGGATFAIGALFGVTMD